MTNRETPTPSVDVLQEIFARDEHTTSIADGLVYTALGFYKDTDYVGLARAAVDLGAVKDLAQAEARLEFIELHDERIPGYDGYWEDSDMIHDRVQAVDELVQDMAPEIQDLFFEESDYEHSRLDSEQFAADNGLTDLL